MNRADNGQVGETRPWHMTVPHDGATESAYRCWTNAIDALVGDGAELVGGGGGLVREWDSHVEVGDWERDWECREYRLGDTIVSLKLDSRNGFTISGDPEVLKPFAGRIAALTKTDNNGLDAEATKEPF